MPQTDKDKRKEYNRQQYLKYKCEHGRQNPKCKECGGSGICGHGREKPRCKECVGRSICGHGREKPHVVRSV